MGDTQPRRLEERLAQEAAMLAVGMLLALIQATLLASPVGFPPPLVLVVAFCQAMIAVGSAFPDNGLFHALRIAVYGGLNLDLLSGMPLGSHSLAIILPSIPIVLLARPLRGSLLLILLTIPLAALGYEALLALLGPLGAAALDWPRYGLVALVPTMFGALVCAPPISYLLRRFNRRRDD